MLIWIRTNCQDDGYEMGHKDGEVIQHSMITKSIERAQKGRGKQFWYSKKTIEFDDVMNSQRTAIYNRRKMLFLERNWI